VKIEYRDGRVAFNVKHRTSHLLPTVEGETEALRERAYTYAQEDWWEDASEAAIEHGFANVYSDGRSGGWLLLDTKREDIEELPAHYLDAENNAATLKRVEAFAEVIGGMMRSDRLAARFVAQLSQLIEEERAERNAQDKEAARRAHKNARDRARRAELRNRMECLEIERNALARALANLVPYAESRCEVLSEDDPDTVCNFAAHAWSVLDEALRLLNSGELAGVDFRDPRPVSCAHCGMEGS
jgi:hypothetical protein